VVGLDDEVAHDGEEQHCAGRHDGQADRRHQMGKEFRIQLLEQVAAQGLAHQKGDRQEEAENHRHGAE